MEASLTDPATIREAAGGIGAIDGVICLAGTRWPIRAQGWDQERIEEMMERLEREKVVLEH